MANLTRTLIRRDGRTSRASFSCFGRSGNPNLRVQTLVDSNQRLLNWYLSFPSQALGIIRIRQRTGWLSVGGGAVSLSVHALDHVSGGCPWIIHSMNLYVIYIYIWLLKFYILATSSTCCHKLVPIQIWQMLTVLPVRSWYPFRHDVWW